MTLSVGIEIDAAGRGDATGLGNTGGGVPGSGASGRGRFSIGAGSSGAESSGTASSGAESFQSRWQSMVMAPGAGGGEPGGTATPKQANLPQPSAARGAALSLQPGGQAAEADKDHAGSTEINRSSDATKLFEPKIDETKIDGAETDETKTDETETDARAAQNALAVAPDAESGPEPGDIRSAAPTDGEAGWGRRRFAPNETAAYSIGSSTADAARKRAMEKGKQDPGAVGAALGIPLDVSLAAAVVVPASVQAAAAVSTVASAAHRAGVAAHADLLAGRQAAAAGEASDGSHGGNVSSQANQTAAAVEAGTSPASGSAPPGDSLEELNAAPAHATQSDGRDWAGSGTDGRPADSGPASQIEANSTADQTADQAAAGRIAQINPQAAAASDPQPPAAMQVLAAGHASAESMTRPSRSKGATSVAMTHGVQAAGGGDASLLGRVPAAVHALNGTTFASGATRAANGMQEAFAALDAAPAPGGASWVHASAHQAEAGFEDPALGWVGVRAAMSGGTVHAAIVPGTADAAQILSGHLAGLGAHLAAAQVSVASVTVDAASGNAGAGSGSMQPGAGHAGADAQSQGQAAEQIGAPIRGLDAVGDGVTRAEFSAGSLSPGNLPYVTGAHISVMA